MAQSSWLMELMITLSIPTSRWGANCRRAKGADISYNAMWFCLLDEAVKIDKGLVILV